MKEKLKQLLINFHSPGRRYSYYPSLPKWEHSLEREEILKSLNSKEVDLYIHIPYCENLCTFCGCNIKITKEKAQFDEYIDKVLSEWKEYKAKIPDLVLNSIFLGGGTPTSLLPHQLQRLIATILDQTPKTETFQGTVETDPRLEQREQLRVLNSFGFNSISIGVQDFDEKTLHNVNRIQTIDDVKRTMNCAVEEGFNETSLDLIYGLPFQTSESFKKTIQQVLELSPTRICNYPLAKVPWQKGPQNAFGIYKTLKTEEMFDLYLESDEALKAGGYQLLGMGHYSKSRNSHSRNIMGYTTNKTYSVLGLGVSAISNFNGILFQNDKILDKYLISKNTIKISHKKNELETKLEEIFLKLTCEYEFVLEEVMALGENKDYLLKNLTYLENNELIELRDQKYLITETGKHFLRTICQTIESFVYN
ncbi:coproporphyrinogen-III oxidase family protein [Halobacteriovorax sp. HLS]|uniref:coproporphyrinogen-III oxidase family protein n=1 Tax=Halobacteriovorax sp. HLS TaxID=2234000 RepID=UPI000FDBC5E0|nr:coproporphyrinogen-III oxidase family protein [Halobacteriovorax sp. HLS]